MTAALQSILASRLKEAAPDAVTAMADHVRGMHQGVSAVLAYGSALRDSQPADTLIDLYLLTETFAGVSTNPLSRLGCRLVPPNVYYAEMAYQGQTYRAKYAALPLSQLEAKTRSTVSNPYFWARFAQPMRPVWCNDKEAEAKILSTIAHACETACANAAGTSPSASPSQQWANLFRETYRTELRPESADRAATLVDADLKYYESISTALKQVEPVKANWPLRRMAGKALSVIRLIKASFTFQGGADYIVWKIKRHSGVEIQVTDFHRRHPLLAGLLLLPQLLRKGAIR
jgi:hypothetical protein